VTPVRPYTLRSPSRDAIIGGNETSGAEREGAVTVSLVNRREFVQSLAATALVGSLPLATSFAQEKRVPVVDTHIHCFAGKDSRSFPYHARAPYRPEPALTPETLLERMKQAGVDYAVIVHPEPYQYSQTTDT
jgi:hypothetical protein